MGARTITPGVYMLTAVCGLTDAASFLALGGVFAEIMTGNIMFLAFEIGQGGGWEVVPRFLVPLVGFGLGAVGCGFLLASPRFGQRRRHAFVVIAVLM
ncbi:MAG: YoaK family protein, partial [Candidatus Nanopelagicales bacterium]